MEKMGITHVYNTADPIPNGQCVGPYSQCWRELEQPSMLFRLICLVLCSAILFFRWLLRCWIRTHTLDNIFYLVSRLIPIVDLLQAMEARCHVGQSIIYDTIGRKGWASDLRAHRIGEIINRVLDEDWDPAPEDQPVEPPEKPSSSALFDRVLRITLGEQLWGWPGRGLPAKRKEPEPENEGKRKKKNPNAVPKAEAETECVDCFRW